MALFLGNYVDENTEMHRSNARRTEISMENDQYYVPECRVPEVGGFWSSEAKKRVTDELFALRRVVKALKEAMAMSSNATIVANAAKWQDEVHRLNMELAAKDAKIRDLEYALESSHKREEYFRSEAEDWEKVASRGQKDVNRSVIDRPKDSRTGQFQPTGLPEIHHSKTDFKVWADYRLHGHSNAVLAKRYGLKTETVSKYIKRYESWYEEGKIPLIELIDGKVYSYEFRNGAPSGRILSHIDNTVKVYKKRA